METKTLKFQTLLFLFMLFAFFGYSQNKAVEILSIRNEDGYLLSAINNSNVQQEITLTIVPKNLDGYSNPITKLIPSNSTIEMIQLYSIKGLKGGYHSSYKFKSNFLIATKEIQDKKNATTDDINLKKGIVVFSKDGCSRCNYTTKFLLNNNINFRLINTSKDTKKNQLMWELIKNDNPYISNLTMPVIIVDGKISYSIKDLNKFVTNIKH